MTTDLDKTEKSASPNQPQEPEPTGSAFDALERLARGATTVNGERWTTLPVDPDDDKWAADKGWWSVWVERENGATTGLPGSVTAPPEVAAFIAACSPENILTLLSALRAAEGDARRYRELRRLLFEDMEEVERLRTLSPSRVDAYLTVPKLRGAQ